ncbi:ring-cleaving dioxygenase [Halobacterium zhouii]|uniref:ring-cleaving dioxygenase n=1 Tax=Halobacterium zhouii TaxID=2902624 RepID=UPI001E64475E|nr:ring-cleaving dioxygenase [Halobacterium zhouii]
MAPTSSDAPATEGVHHVTAVAGDPAENVRFYREELGLRLVKRTVNFDDPSTYHLYYGDETGTPGTILTFFPFGGGRSGTPGRGQATATAFVVPEGSLEYWTQRFEERDIPHEGPTDRFGARVLAFADPDGQPLELVEGESDVEPWDGSDVPAEHAVRGFHGVTLHPTDPEATGTVLEALGFESAATESEASGERVRYVAGDRASVVDVLTGDGPRGRPGPGTIHHVAFRAPDDDAQAALASAASETGVRTTPQKDRQYFRSIYFREPGGVLFEVATDEPGFAIDEDVADLGASLKLPPWLEDDREQLEAALPPLDGGTNSAVDADAEVNR